MAFLDSLVWLTITMVVGGGIGIGISKAFLSYQKTQDKNRLLEVIEGKVPNNLKLEGATINVNKFTYKESDGNIKEKVKFSDLVKKTPPVPLKQEKTTPIKAIKDYFKKIWNNSKGKKK